ncbi:lipid-A-disaccharide synthase [Propionivibrio sp.]|uniref:lipid-A-disaccharide synthase n=1 Tax=Propionivibrio sp. TaxID=2212460 RepID=UPI0025DA6982|nr:lipid-A-disaccharide synthase [Propionivibrio sp.]MBK7356517.1 lipid-A-disaccharide synthase [Propionivibrio sp.]MBK8400930.1 lipid-A-disaccharide synthase [Propionivibrio sp.]MBK8745278.1 lipid-A-disaccharide synthase [Propionivibrio sp.]MBK8894215.1 lipid-A-disaccharide synthase [Propionivibrio sp.]MBL0207660.1 lipid-A-disaccharide synthase [Propionivibrio sp.]
MIPRGLRIAMVAGETSGDLLASHLIDALKAKLPDSVFYGIGGPKMEGQGFDVWFPMEKLAVLGYAEALKHYLEISSIRRKLKRRLLADPPDLFIGVDAPDFNLGLEKAIKQRGIPCIHYVSPSIWAWRGKRIYKIGAAVSRVLALFPFEPMLYEKQRIPVSYVGHPLADILPLEDGRQIARELLGLPHQRPVFTLLPGSRQSELQYLADIFIKTACEIHRRMPDALFLVPLATRETRLLFENALYRCQARDRPINMLFGHAHEAMMASDVVLVASGTATLEAALLKRPMVIAYKMAPFSYRLMRRMSYLPYVGLPNILAGRFIVPEFIQDDVTPENLVQAMLNLYADKSTCVSLSRVFREMHLQLKQNTAEKAALAVLDCLPVAAGDHA